MIRLGWTAGFRLLFQLLWLIMLTLRYINCRFWLLTSAFLTLGGLQPQLQLNWKMELYLLRIRYLSIHRCVVGNWFCDYLVFLYSSYSSTHRYMKLQTTFTMCLDREFGGKGSGIRFPFLDMETGKRSGGSIFLPLLI